MNTDRQIRNCLINLIFTSTVPAQPKDAEFNLLGNIGRFTHVLFDLSLAKYRSCEDKAGAKALRRVHHTRCRHVILLVYKFAVLPGSIQTARKT